MSSCETSVGSESHHLVRPWPFSDVLWSGNFHDTVNRLQNCLESLTAQHNSEVSALRAENKHLRTACARPSASRGASGGALWPVRPGSPPGPAPPPRALPRDPCQRCGQGAEHGTPIGGAFAAAGASQSQCWSAGQDSEAGAEAGGQGALETNSKTDGDVNAAYAVWEVGMNTLQKQASELPSQGSATYSSENSMQKKSSRFERRPSKVSSLSIEGRLTKIVKSKVFEVGFGVLIVLNSVLVGLEAQLLVSAANQHVEIALDIFEHIITLFFLIELLLRMRVYGWRTFLPTSSANIWNFMDAMLVLVVGVAFGWVWSLLRWAIGGGIQSGTLRAFTVLRAFRLARLALVVQKVEFFNEAWLLIRGLTNSARTLFWTVIVILFLAYVFAVFGLVLIGQDFLERYNEASIGSAEWEDLGLLVEYTSSLDRLMFTLMQLLTTDNWSDVVRLSIRYSTLSWMYFYCYMGIVVIVLMNLVTAIIVENALTTSKIDEEKQLDLKERKKKDELKNLNLIFDMMDLDGDGTLSWDEFESAFEQEVICNKWKLLDFQPDEYKELFKLLDRGDGVIRLSDFHDGLSRMHGTAQSKDVFQIMKSLEDLRNAVSEIATLHNAGQCPQTASSPRSHWREALPLEGYGAPLDQGTSSGASAVPSWPLSWAR
uniref:EF-hand domain-containing protein n=1 Tax=Pyrodinium bahamense TaxID=73915 RepID=A0A7S0FSV3_9DINO